MKFLTKNKSLVKEADKKNNKKVSGNSSSSSMTGVSSSLLFWVYQPALLALGLMMLVYVLIDFLFIQPAEQQQDVQIKTILAVSVAQSFDSYIHSRELALKSLAKSPLIHALIENNSDESSLKNVLSAVINELDQLYVISSEELSLIDTRNPQLSFASIDLIRRAVAGKIVKAEAFFSNKVWMFQIAVPVTSEDKKVLGALLATFNLSAIKSLFVLPSSLPEGKLSLMSNNGVRDREVMTKGSGDQNLSITVPTAIAQWKINYAPLLLSSFDRMTVWVVFSVLGLVLAIAIFLMCRIKMTAIRNDLLQATDHLQKVLSGEARKMKPFSFGEIYSMVVALSQKGKDLNRELTKKITNQGAAGEDEVKGKSAISAPAIDDDAPLFDDDLLDLDVLSESDAESDPLALDENLQDESNDMLTEVQGLGIDVPQSIFRAYDIRGVVNETLSEGIVELIGKAVATEALAQGQKALCVGYDGRLSSVDYCEALTRGIISTGIDAIIIGQVPTPVLYFATHHFDTGSGVMVTGSHNPSNYNGFKMMIAGNTLSGDDIQKIYNRILLQDFAIGQGSRSDQPVDQDYLDTILNDIAVAAPLKVVVDAGNGVAGGLAPTLIEDLGCEVIPLFCEVDGNFPNHHPDPGKPENLQDLIAAVKEHNADIGLAFDGDGDRLGVVTNTGKIIWPDRLLMLFAKDVVSRNPGADIIYDVKCSRRLNGLISSYGGRPVMWKTGHSLIKAKMKETGALLAGEMSGHMFFKERWFGFDDGLYSAARLLEILGVEDRSAEEVFASFPEDVSTPEINIAVTDESKFTIIEKLCLLKGMFTGGNVTTIDGLRVDFPNGWGLCRASNTTPVLVLRFEADDEDALEEIKEKFKTQLKSIDPELDLNF